MIAVMDAATALIESIDELPPLPAVAARVMTMVEDDTTSASNLAQVLATDQALTAKLIRISNSAYYGFARQVSTVREAVTLLGFRQVREVAIATSLMNAFKRPIPADDGFDLDLFWGHSVAVAVAAEAVAKKTRAARPQDAFTAGILHDIGRLVLRMVRPREFAAAVAIARSGAMSLNEAEIHTTGYSHEDLGRALGAKWKFPGHLLDAVGAHHDESRSPEADGIAGVIARCHRFVLHYGLFCGYDLGEGESGPLPEDLTPIEAMCGGIDIVLDRAFAFIEAASGIPERWYQAAGAARS
ncbi:MAG: HDOD domain-containing protein [Dehalococcoidia bacterium]